MLVTIICVIILLSIVLLAFSLCRVASDADDQMEDDNAK